MVQLAAAPGPVVGQPGPVTLEVAGAERWAAAARASGQRRTPFHEHGWLAVAARLTGTRFTPLVVVADGADVGVVPWMERRRGPVSTVNALPFPYAGPLVPPSLTLPTLQALRRRARRTGVLRYEFGFSPTTDVGLAGLAGSGLDLRVDGTYLIDTSQDVEALAAGLSSSCRRSLRKDEKDGVHVIPAPDGRTTDAVLTAAYGSRGLDSGYADGFPVSPAEMAATGVDVRWTVAVKDGVQLGMLLTVASAEVAHVWLSGILPEHRSTRANVTLYWDAVRWAAERGVPTLDLVGIPDEGIGRFKAQFGGTVHEYARLSATAPGLDRAKALLGRVRGAVVRE